MDIEVRIYTNDSGYKSSISIRLNDGEFIDALERYIKQEYLRDDEVFTSESHIENIYSI
jgi:hypothetical protein